METISASGGLELLQMVSEPDTRGCASKDARSPREVETISTSGGLELLQMVSKTDTRGCASKDAGSPREVDCEIPHWLGRGTKHFS